MQLMGKLERERLKPFKVVARGRAKFNPAVILAVVAGIPP
jgi:hypothetical protein